MELLESRVLFRQMVYTEEKGGNVGNGNSTIFYIKCWLLKIYSATTLTNLYSFRRLVVNAIGQQPFKLEEK